MLGKLTQGDAGADAIAFHDPNKEHLVQEVSLKQPVTYNPQGEVKIVAVDCGIKFNQIRCLCKRGASVTVVPWNHKLDSKGLCGSIIY